MAKKFFYVCAGLFMLLLAFCMGARSVPAQVGAQVSAGGFLFPNSNGVFVAGVAGRTVYFSSNFPVNAPVTQIAAPIPGTSPVVAVSPWGSGGEFLALLANGDVYEWSSTYGWYNGGNLLGMATSTSNTTWGQVKSTYRK